MQNNYYFKGGIMHGKALLMFTQFPLNKINGEEIKTDTKQNEGGIIRK